MYGPDGFLTSFAGRSSRPPERRPGPGRHRRPAVRPGQDGQAHAGQRGQQAIVYTLTPNDYEGSTQTVNVTPGSPWSINWPTDQDGYYDVVITANTADGFRRRYAGRIA